MEKEKRYMLRALALAERAKGLTHPNPMVGCVIAKGNKIISEGFHTRFGAAHAEVEALKKAGQKAKGACLYVNLEPCAHFGKTPPCTDAIIKSGIKKVFIAMHDPNPINNGKGAKMLESSGIKVKSGICENQAKDLNASFIKYITKGSPFVTLKMAQSLDGKIATKTGDASWISSASSRRLVHLWRKQADAVMVGAGAVLKDDPLLTARTGDRNQKPKGRQPIKIIVDSGLKIPLSAKIFSKKSPAKTIIITSKNAPKNKIRALLNKKNTEILAFDSRDGKINLKNAMKLLAKKGIINIMIEGGGELTGSALTQGIVDKVLFFVAPKIIGGRSAKTSVEGDGVGRAADALTIKNLTVEKIGPDYLFTGEPCLQA